MPSEYNLATPLDANPNMQAFIQVVREELALIDFTRLFVYLFDTVDESLLDILAEQFDMLGYNGWVLAETPEQKRELLKSAFELHAIKGTPGGIREAVKRLGFQDIVIEENYEAGAPVGAPHPWAYFKVTYVLSDTRSLTANDSLHLVSFINSYKNVRSIMADFAFEQVTVEAMELPEIVTVEIT